MQHLAIIPDGNRRWAKNNKLKAIFGHKRGLDGFRTAAGFCIKKGIKYLSIYIFSSENFNRPEDEKKYLFNIFVTDHKKKLAEFIEQGIKVKFIGNKKLFPEKVRPIILDIEQKTAHLKKLNLNFLFCYGSKYEIVDAVKRMSAKVKSGKLDVEKIDESLLSSFLWTSGIPDPDLIIRTSKRPRLSNFLLYQAAYSEFKFLDCYWPEITEDHFEQCFNEFKSTQRNFGK